MNDTETMAIIGDGVYAYAIALALLNSGHSVHLFSKKKQTGQASQASGGLLEWRGSRQQISAYRQCLVQSLKTWPTFLKHQLEDSSRLTKQGSLHIISRKTEESALLKQIEKEKSQFQVLPPETLAFNIPETHQLYYFEEDQRIDVRGYFQQLKARCLANTSFSLIRGDAIHLEKGSSYRVLCDQKYYSFSKLTIAAGMGSKSLVEELGYPFKLRSIQGESCLFQSNSLKIDANLHWETEFVLAQIGEGNYYLGTTEDKNRMDLESTDKLKQLIARAEELLGISIEPKQKMIGWRTAVKDTKPMIGMLEDNLYLATAQHKSGIALLPLAVDALLSLILNRNIVKNTEIIRQFLSMSDPKRKKGPGYKIENQRKTDLANGIRRP